MMNTLRHEGSFVLLLTGPAGAGKTTVAHAWASQQARPTVHISLDDVREFVKSGYANPSDGFASAVEQQCHLARQGCAALALIYAQAGFLVMIDDAIFPEWEAVGYNEWHELLLEVPHALIVLLPTFEEVAERNQYRSGQRLLSQDMLRVIYEMMLPWRNQHIFPVIDNSSLSVEETVARLQSEVEKLTRG